VGLGAGQAKSHPRWPADQKKKNRLKGIRVGPLTKKKKTG
jgi:hypothetical protein